MELFGLCFQKSDYTLIITNDKINLFSMLPAEIV